VTTATATGEAAAPAPSRLAGGGALIGTGALVRFIARRDRIKLPAWLLGITLMLAYYSSALPEVYQTDKQLQGLSPFMEGPVGALLSGPGYGVGDLTIERIIVGVYGLYFLLLAGLMNVLLVSRHTRVEEQNGRTELIRANVVGRHAQLTAVLIVAVVANMLLALLLGGAMAANGFDGGQGLLFGAGVGAAGLVFAGIAAITVQVTEFSRAASGIAGAVLGGAYVIRAIGDMIREHGSELSWFSPLAWSQQTRPYVDGRWWPLTLSLALAVAAAAVGYALSTRRDVGAGLVAARLGRPEAKPWLGSPFGLALRLQRAPLIWWPVALALTGLLYGGITDSILDVYNDMSEDMLAVFGGDRANLLDGYLGVIALWTVLLVGVMVILGVQSLRSEETKGRVEPVLATATSRWNWFGSYLMVLALGAVGALLVVGLATGIGVAISVGDAGYVWELTAAHVAHAPAVLVLLGIAALLFAVVPRAIGVTWAVLGYALIVGFFGPLMDLPQWAYNMSPLEHIGRAPLDPLTWPPVLILTAIAAGLATLGLAAFGRRDLDTK
jgi:ABC-2 type transport system permease protein